MLLLVISPGRSRVPRRSVVEVTLISCLQDQGSSQSSGDLLLLSVPEGDLWPVGTICDAWSQSRLPAPRDTGMPRTTSTSRDEEWGSGGRDAPAMKCWSIAGEKQQKCKGRDGSKLLL